MPESESLRNPENEPMKRVYLSQVDSRTFFALQEQHGATIYRTDLRPNTNVPQRSLSLSPPTIDPFPYCPPDYKMSISPYGASPLIGSPCAAHVYIEIPESALESPEA